MPVKIKGKSFCLTGALSTVNKETGKPLSKGVIGKIIEEQGGTFKKSVVKTLDYLVTGGEGSDYYINGNKGSKILKAEAQPNTRIITEKELLEALGY